MPLWGYREERAAKVVRVREGAAVFQFCPPGPPRERERSPGWGLRSVAAKNGCVCPDVVSGAGPARETRPPRGSTMPAYESYSHRMMRGRVLCYPGS